VKIALARCAIVDAKLVLDELRDNNLATLRSAVTQRNQHVHERHRLLRGSPGLYQGEAPAKDIS
jgi:hypothetical protein